MDAGYALLLTKSLYGYVDLKYMAVMPWFRGRGLGVQLMGQCRAAQLDAVKAADGGHGLFGDLFREDVGVDVDDAVGWHGKKILPSAKSRWPV